LAGQAASQQQFQQLYAGQQAVQHQIQQLLGTLQALGQVDFQGCHKVVILKEK